MTGRAAVDPVVAARARADAARARLSGTLGQLQHRASPQVLAQDVAATLKERGVDALTGLADTARRRPVAAGVAVAAIGLFLVRGQVFGLLRRTAIRRR